MQRLLPKAAHLERFLRAMDVHRLSRTRRRRSCPGTRREGAARRSGAPGEMLERARVRRAARAGGAAEGGRGRGAPTPNQGARRGPPPGSGARGGHLIWLSLVPQAEARVRAAHFLLEQESAFEELECDIADVADAIRQVSSSTLLPRFLRMVVACSNKRVEVSRKGASLSGIDLAGLLALARTKLADKKTTLPRTWRGASSEAATLRSGTCSGCTESVRPWPRRAGCRGTTCSGARGRLRSTWSRSRRY